MKTQIDPQNPPAVYEWDGPTGVHFKDVREPSGTYFREGTPRAVIDALERARVSGAHVRLFLGDAKTGRDWLEENDVAGRVGRSTGWLKTALLIAKPSDDGGGAISADCIVRLMVAGREVYRHPNYAEPVIVISRENFSAAYPWAASVNGSPAHARFKTEHKAIRWAQFMRGEVTKL